MDGQLADPCCCGPANQSAEMVNVAVDAAIGAKAQQVQGAVAVHNPFSQLLQCRGGLELVIANGVADPHQFLADDPTRTDGEVTHLGIAHLLIRQAHMGAAGLNQRVWVGMPKRFHHRGLALVNRVMGCIVPMAPAIEDRQDNRRNTGVSP